MKCYLQYNWPGQSRLIGCLLGCHYQRFFTSDKSDSFKENPSTTTATTHWTLSISGFIFPPFRKKDRTWNLSGLASREEPFEIHFCRWARCRVYLCQVPLSRRILSKNVSWIGLVSCFLVRFSLLRIFLVRFCLCSLTHRIPTEFWLLASWLRH